MPHVLFLSAIDDSHLVRVHRVLEQGLEFGVFGSIDLYRDLQVPEISWEVVTLGGIAGGLPRIRQRPDLVFNGITDADTSRRGLELAMQLIRELRPPRVLNRPVHVLATRRDDVAHTLAGIPGVVVPETVRITPDSHQAVLDAVAQGPGFPVIIRKAGTHGGETMLRLDGPQDAHLLERIACDGHTTYYLVRFVDFRDAGGVYRKLRLVFVGDRVFPRHWLASDDWNVHASTRKGYMAAHPQTFTDEAAFLDAFPRETLPVLRDRLAAIAGRLKLDYFSMDCALLPDGDLLVFEANASGNALRQPGIEQYPWLERPVHQLRQGVLRLLLAPEAARAG